MCIITLPHYTQTHTQIHTNLLHTHTFHVFSCFVEISAPCCWITHPSAKSLLLFPLASFNTSLQHKPHSRLRVDSPRAHRFILSGYPCLHVLKALLVQKYATTQNEKDRNWQIFQDTTLLLPALFTCIFLFTRVLYIYLYNTCRLLYTWT